MSRGIGPVLIVLLVATCCWGATEPDPTPAWKHIRPAASPEGLRISLDVKNAPVRDVIQELARAARVSPVFHGTVEGKITARLDRVPWRDALNAACRAGGLTCSLDGRVLEIEPLGGHR